MFLENVKNLFTNLENRIGEIPAGRKELLQKFSQEIFLKLKKSEPVNLIFICTHNSRRSHMAQIWAQTAASFYTIPDVFCFSGGTEATSFNPRSVNAVLKSGFKVEKSEGSNNPLYKVYYSMKKDPIKCFSKKYDDHYNPNKNFIAIMTCSDADENCPIIYGADKRFSITYNDPKEFDNTEHEEIKYVERFEQIGIETIYAFKMIREMIDLD